jgi:hypothetical protein
MFRCELGELTDAEYADAVSINEMAFQVYLDRRFNLNGGADHATAMTAMREWDAMMRGEMTMEEYDGK